MKSGFELMAYLVPMVGNSQDETEKSEADPVSCICTEENGTENNLYVAKGRTNVSLMGENKLIA